MAEEPSKTQASDPFYLEGVFPEPIPLFEFAPRDLDEVFDGAICVLDTNALLVPYGADPASLAAIKSAYTELIGENRLFIPAHVAREFAKNRPEKLKTLYDQLAQRQSANISAGQYPPLLEGLPEYETLRTTELEMLSKLKEYREALRGVLGVVRKWNWNDPVSSLYRDLFRGEVIVECTQSQDALRKDLSRRTEHRVPPGYKDSGKDLGRAGDLIIWHTILQIGAAKKSDLVFVSGDEKADWWYRASERALYPRFELLDEYRRASAGRSFHITSLADLLQRTGAERTVVDAVRDEEIASRATVRTKWEQNAWRNDAKAIVRQWARKRYSTIMEDAEGRLWASESTASPAGRVRVHVVFDVERDLEARLLAWLTPKAGHRQIAIIVTPARLARRCAFNAIAIFRRTGAAPPGAELIVGSIKEGEFKPITELKQGAELLIEESLGEDVDGEA